MTKGRKAPFLALIEFCCAPTRCGFVACDSGLCLGRHTAYGAKKSGVQRRSHLVNRMHIRGVPQTRVIGLRNILAHGYEQIEHEVLYKAVVDDLPALATVLEAWLGTPVALVAGQ